MSQEILRELHEMEGRLAAEIAANRTEMGRSEERLHGRINLVDQKVDQQQEATKALAAKVQCADTKVGNLRVESAVTKTKVGGIAAIVAAVLTGLAEAFRRVVG